MADSDDIDGGFDALLYLATNDEFARAFDEGVIRNGAEHWRDAGRGEARIGIRPSLSETAVEPPAYSAGAPAAAFDAAFYLDINADLRAAFGDDEAAARRHWADHGSIEGRFGAGDAPHARRSPDLAALLDRPFGVDLHLAAEEAGIAATLGHRLLRALRAAGIPVSPRPFVERDAAPLLPSRAAARPGTFRISLIAAAPYTMRRLLRAHPMGHFDASYVIAAWPGAALAPHTLDFPALGGIDELWMPAPLVRDAWASFAPLPVRTVAPSPVPLRPRQEARALLGLPADDRRVVLLDAGMRDGALDAAARRLLAPGDVRLLVRAGADRLVGTRRALAGIPDVTVLADRRLGGGSILLAASDCLVAAAGLEPDIADALASGRVVWGGGASPTPPSVEQVAATVSARLRALELDTPPPVFARALGRSRQTALPVPPREPGTRIRPDLPVLSILLETPHVSRAELDDILAALAAQGHPFWELCLAAAPAGRRRDDPRLRTCARPLAPTRAARLNEAASLATGWLLPARIPSEARALAAALSRIAAVLDDETDILVAAEPGEGADAADRIEAGGAASRPVAIRLEAAREAGLFSDRFDPATEHDLLLRLRARRAKVATAPDLPVGAESGPAADEAGRLALGAHLRSVIGPLARAEAGLVANTWRRRLHLPRPLHAAIVVTGASRLRTALLPDGVTVHRISGWRDLPTAPVERLILLDDAVECAPMQAIRALLEWTEEQEIGAAGGRILEADTTIRSAGLAVQPDGGLSHACRGLPNDPSCARAAFVTRNPPAVAGAFATRRTLLLQAPFADGLLEAEAGFDLLAADFCLRLARDFARRTVYVPDAEFTLIDDALEPAATSAPVATLSARLFAERWARPPAQD